MSDKDIIKAVISVSGLSVTSLCSDNFLFCLASLYPDLGLKRSLGLYQRVRTGLYYGYRSLEDFEKELESED